MNSLNNPNSLSGYSNPNKIRAILVDDSHLSRANFKAVLAQRFADIITIVFESTSRGTTLRKYQVYKEKNPSQDIDIAFLDLDLNDGTALDLLNDFDVVPFPVVFFTSHTKFAVEAFKYEPLGFITKPLESEEFNRVISYAIANLHRRAINRKAYLERSLSFDSETPVIPAAQAELAQKFPSSFVPRGTLITLEAIQGTIMVPPARIVYFKVSEYGNSSVLLDDETSLTFTTTIGEWESRLTELKEQTFIRVQRGLLLNASFIIEVLALSRDCSVLLSNGEQHHISTASVEKVYEAIRRSTVSIASIPSPNLSIGQSDDAEANSVEKSNQETNNTAAAVNDSTTDSPILDDSTCEIIVQTKTGASVMDVAGVYYCESVQQEIVFHTKDSCKRLVSGESVELLYDTLFRFGFRRIYKSLAVNIRYCVELSNNGKGGTVRLANGVELPVSRTYKRSIAEAIFKRIILSQQQKTTE